MSPHPIATYIRCTDPISAAGMTSQLVDRDELRIVESPDAVPNPVTVVVAEQLDGGTAELLLSLGAGRHQHAVLVATTIDESSLWTAAEVGVRGVLRRADATADALVRTISRVAAGDGDLPPDLVGGLLGQIGRLQHQVLAPHGLALSGLAVREYEVVRLVAEGHDTAEIALRMSYSERTVKKILHDLTSRLHLKNRTHLVAYAMREGLL